MTTPPERIHSWQDSQLSIARFYGGITYQGRTYTIAVAEKGAPLVRDDVLVREAKEPFAFPPPSMSSKRNKAQWKSDTHGRRKP